MKKIFPYLLTALVLSAIILLLLIFTSCSPVFAQKPTITISTANAIPLQTKFGVNLPDMYFSGKASKGNYFNVNQQPFLSNFSTVGFNSGTVIVAGSLHKYVHPNMSGDISKSNGYNFNQADFTKLGVDDYSTFDQGVATGNFKGKDFINDALTFCVNENFGIDVVANVVNGTWGELNWYLKNYHVQRVILGAEQVTIDGYDVSTYCATVRTWITNIRRNYPSVIVCLDAAPVYKNTRNAQRWNDSIKTLDADEADAYNQAGDNVTYTSDMTANVAALNTYFNVTLSAQDSTFVSEFPDFRMTVDEVQMEDNRANVQYINNTMVSAWGFGKLYEHYLLNTSLIAEANYMSGSNLFDSWGNPSINCIAVSLISQMWKGNPKVTNVQFTGTNGVTGACTFQNGMYCLLINNSSDNSYTVNSTTVDGSKKKSFTRNTIYASTWTGIVLNEYTTESKITIEPHSVSVVTF